MPGNLTRIEKAVETCLNFGSDDEIIDFLNSQELTIVEGREIFQKVGLTSKSLENEEYAQRLKVTNAIPFYKRKHEGIFDHYLSILNKNPHFTTDAVESIQNSVEETRIRMKYREPLHRTNSYGLVLGRIQSGKTAHLIGTVLHALDSKYTPEPFDTIIILSGLIDDLRIQTRDRFDAILNSFSGTKIQLLPEREKDLNHSNLQDSNFFRTHLKPNQHNSSILVVKKNHHILENILNILQEKPYYQNKKFLIIDDEADHASMDTNAETYEIDGDIIDENPSLTNQLLRTIVKLLTSSKRCWYIGYTATPYANLLMMPHSDDTTNEFGLPLFPRDFLHALPKPEGHLDNEYYFSTPPGHEHVQIRTPPDSESQEEDDLVSELLHRHLLTQIIKGVKGINQHHTTLVHTDITVQEHNRYVESFKGVLKQIREDRKPGDVVRELMILLKDYSLTLKWENETVAELESLKSDWPKLMLHIRKIKIVEVNRRPQSIDDKNSQDLEYSKGSVKRSYIAVGGTRLSRGLTLEGLTTTWFSRAAVTPVYDTMLQMARWCGYRTDYDELVKIYTTNEIRDYYRRITEVEKEIRHQIERLPPDSSPMNTLVWIKEHAGMKVTAKMPADYSRKDWGEVSTPNFWSYEPPYFGSNPESTSKNIFKEFERLITRIGGGSKIINPPLNGNGSFKLKMNVRNNKVKDFIRSYISGYETKENSLTFVRLNQILNTWSESYNWNVAIHTPDVSPKKIVRGLEIGLVQRKTELENPVRFSLIQGSSEDIGVDVRPGEHRNQPLLLIYLIKPESKTKYGGIEKRVFASKLITPAIGIGISFPNEMIGDGGSMVARTE